MILEICIIVAAVCMILCFLIRSKRKVKRTLNCAEGRFSVRGKKDRFIVKKGRRFAFIVENGQITSLKDRAASSEWIKYRGD